MPFEKGKPLVIGLTGGPGVGKSEVAKILESNGAKLISADKIGHVVLATNRIVRAKLIKLLGDEIIGAERELDRKKIGAIVFGTPTIMHEFNRIVHPPLLRSLRMLINEELPKARFVVVDAALIFEWGIADWFDLILVVQAKRAARISRMVKQGLSKIQASRRIASQMGQKDKVALADYVIENNSNMSSLRGKTQEFFEILRQKFKQDIKN